MTHPSRQLLTLLIAVLLTLAACGPGDASPVPPGPTAEGGLASDPPASVMPTARSTAVPSPADATPAPASASPAIALDQAWATAELVDVTSGETFRIADLAGEPVIIETMAIWCSNCLAQQRQVNEALEIMGADAPAVVIIDIDPSETADALARYREQHGFAGRYAVADRDLARALAAEFGDQVLNPPATPMILIGRDGRVTLTPYGKPKSPDEVVALAREHGA